MYESDAAFTVATWGPSLILLFAVLLIIWLAYWTWKRNTAAERLRFNASLDYRSDELNVALESALALNSYNINDQNDPSVHLGAVVRFRPKDYQNSVHEIMLRFREGQVVSIDLGIMDIRQAARLVDFCSGMAAVDAGWIFRVADRVIILTPHT